MRSFIGALVATLLLAGAGWSAEAEGLIQSIDKENSVIVLENGESYKLPGEFDADMLKQGMDIVFAYEQVDGENLITDMQLPE